MKAILIADIHLREDQPECRTDDYFSAQEEKVDWLADLAERLDAPVIAAGDIFDKWKQSPFLLGWALDHMPFIHAIPGQHDLPQHRLGAMRKSALYVLEAGQGANPLDSERSELLGGALRCFGAGWGQDPEEPPPGSGETILLALHRMVWTGRRPWPGCEAPSAVALLKRFLWADIILTGDNHLPFLIESQGRFLVNPGSMMRMTAAQVDHQPRVYIWDSETGKITPEYFPIRKGVVSREHIERAQERDERVEAYVEKLLSEVEIGLSFENNLTEFYRTNRTRRSVREAIGQAMEEE